MTIISLQYANSDNTSIKVTEDDGNIYFAPWPCFTWHAKVIQDAIDGGMTILNYVNPVLPAPVYTTKLRIIDNIIAANKLTEALTALNSDPVKKARWDAAVQIDVEDQDVIDLIVSIGLDPEIILS